MNRLEPGFVVGHLRAAPCDGGPVRVALVAVAAERSGKAVQRFAPGAEKIAELSGALVVRIAMGESAVALDLAKLPASATVGGTTLTVLETGDGSLKIEVRGSLFPPKKGAEATLPDIAFLEEGKAHGVFDRPKGNSVRLVAVDAAGKPVGNTGWSGSGVGGSMTYECSMEGMPVKLTVKAAKSLERREVPFRFADVPLPK